MRLIALFCFLSSVSGNKQTSGIETCCRVKKNAGKIFKLASFDEEYTEKYGCLNGCIYTSPEKPGKRFCFQRSRQGHKSQCVEQVKEAEAYSVSFQKFKNKFGKIYETTEHEMHRQEVWAENVDYIKRHNEEYNKGIHTFTVGENEFADLSAKEFRNLLLGYGNVSKGRVDSPIVGGGEAEENGGMLPTVDWREKGYVTPVKNQGQCGSCWAFSTTGALEGAHFAKTGQLVSLSEQNLVDCSRQWGTYGCSGGYMDHAFAYIRDNGGIDTEDSYPYTGRDGDCYFDRGSVGATLSSWVDIPWGKEKALQKAISQVGPVAVAVDASRSSFQLYRSGVYSDPYCNPSNLNHAVLVVGYGTYYTWDYWLVKNSWGVSWGDMGYIKMIRNYNNMCGIASTASYPVV